MRQMGWMRELPDHRDYILDEHPDTAKLLRGPAVLGGSLAAASEPSSIDLSAYFSPVEDQGALGSCTAQAVVGIAEYLERRVRGAHTDGSRLFLYKTSRNLLGWVGDTGMYMRTAMKALALFGTPPERFWPYDIERFDAEPGVFAYAYAQRYRALNYFRLDKTGRSRPQLLSLMRSVMVYGLPVAFGFVVYSFGDERGAFPMPEPGQRPYGGHAVVAAGYDDNIKIGESVGAIKIRNSWGVKWGQKGYGWLPYDYIRGGLSADFWTLYGASYVRD